MTDFLKWGSCLLLILGFALIGSACRQEGGDVVPETGSNDKTVSWPELVRLDEVSYRAEGLVRAGDLAAVRKSRTEVLEAGWAVNQASVPSNVADPLQVEVLLIDLNSLIIDLAAADLDDETLSSLVLGLHPVIEKLIEAAGMPHLHGHEGEQVGIRAEGRALKPGPVRVNSFTPRAFLATSSQPGQPLAPASHAPVE